MCIRDRMWGTSLSAPGPVESEKNDVYDYPSKFVPYNMVFDVKRKLPYSTKAKSPKVYIVQDTT